MCNYSSSRVWRRSYRYLIELKVSRDNTGLVELHSGRSFFDCCRLKYISRFTHRLSIILALTNVSDKNLILIDAKLCAPWSSFFELLRLRSRWCRAEEDAEILFSSGSVLFNGPELNRRSLCDGMIQAWFVNLCTCLNLILSTFPWPKEHIIWLNHEGPLPAITKRFKK